MVKGRKEAFLFITVFVALSAICYLLPYSWLAIVPRDKSHLAGIVISPLAHASAEHLLYNYVYLIPFALTIVFLEKRPIYQITSIYLLTGTLVWFFGKDGLHIGMSGFAIGCSVYLIASGIINLSKNYLIISVITLITQGMILISVFKPHDGVSDDAHISGALAGLIVAFTTHFVLGPKK